MTPQGLRAGRSCAQSRPRPCGGAEPVGACTLDYVTGCLANLMEEDNPKFNKDRFIKAAGGKQ